MKLNKVFTRYCIANIFCCALLCLFSPAIFAQCPVGSTQVMGNSYFNTAGVNDAPAGYGYWTEYYQITSTSDGIAPYGYCSVSPNLYTQSLIKVNYGFNIPCNATINQVDLIIYRRNNAAVGDVRDLEVYLRMPDHSVSTYNAATTTSWLNSSTAFEAYTYAHANWGETLTPDIVNDPRFGMQLRVGNNDASNVATPEIDAMQMRVCYSVAGTPYTTITSSIALTGDNLCSPVQEGDITFTTTNGSGTYEYSIDGGNTWLSSNSFSNITQGVYEITVRNADGTCETKPDLAYVGCNTGKILQYGDAVVACKSNFGNTPTLGIKPIQAFPQMYNNGVLGVDVSDSIPNSTYMWSYNELGGDVFATAIDQNFNIYTGVTGLYDFTPGAPAVSPRLLKIDGVTGAITLLDILPGTTGIAYLEWDTICNQLYVVNSDDGKIYRHTGTVGGTLSIFDPLVPDLTSNGFAPLGERILGVAYNYVQNRLYYSLWVNDAINNGLRNEIRSVAIDVAGTCDFLPATDRLEILLPFLSEYGGGGTYSMPVGDIEISNDGQIMLLSEIGFNSIVPVGQPHEARVLEYQLSGSTWLHNDDKPASNTSYRHEVGSLNAGKNSRGGIDFAYESMTQGCSVNPNAFIVATVDALTGVACEEKGCYYGFQYWPITGGNFGGSVIMDIARSPLSQEKSIYGDVDVVSGCCPCAVYCPYITSASEPVTVCVGETGANLTAQTDQNEANSITFVKFTSDQMLGTDPTASEATAIYTTGTPISTVTPFYTASTIPYVATYNYNPADFPNTTGSILTYYVYAILNPDMGATCRPVQEMIVNVLPKNTGIVWVDTNNDGIHDIDETQSIANVPVTAYWDDCAGNTGIVTTTTNSEGYYFLNNIPDGAKVRVEFDLPTGTYVQGIAGTDNPTSTQFTTTPDCNIDVAVTQSSILQIGNYVWFDQDEDGVQDPCEMPLNNVEVQLKEGTNLVARTFTNTDGTYYFGGSNNEGFTYESTTTSPQIYEAPITNTIYDARQNSTGVANGAGGLQLNDRYLGVMYPNVNIPAGATITSASIRFTASIAGNISNVVIKGETNPDAAIWNTSNSTELSTRFNNSTTSQVTWNNANTWVVEESGINQTTPDLTAIVSEIISLPTWERDKTLAFLIQAPVNAGGATAYDVSGGASKGAVLHIEYIGTSEITGGSLSPSTNYTICIPLSQTPITSANLAPTLVNSTLSNGNDQNDSDGVSNGTASAITMVSPASGSNHTYDFGFRIACNLTATADGTNVLCNGGIDGTATATASGNIAAVTYLWSNGGTTATISNLAAGTYTVTISETASCTAVASYTVTEPALLDITCDKTDVTTNGGADGTATVSATGGTSPYTYLWNSGETTASISNKTAATYTVTVTDANNCTAICNSTINEPGCNLSATADGTNVLCNGGTDGTATATASGNVAAVTYLWSNGATTDAISNLAAGTYTVTISETASCTAVASYTVTEPALLDITCDKTDVTTNGGSDGTASVVATGGTSPYTYLWNSGETTASISNKTVATYTVTVTDANNCTAICNSTINEPGCNLSAMADGTNVLCNGGTDGTVTATASGNIAAVTYLWSNGGTTATINNLAAGTYTVTISETASCTAVASYTVTEPALLDITCDKTDVTTNGGSDGTASVVATGGTSPYTYLWNSGETTASISNKTAATYTVTVTDANGCTDVCASSINEPGVLCNLTGAGLAGVTCNDNGTSANATDDYIGFTLNPMGTTLGSGYVVTVSSGSITPNTGTYGAASNFQLQNGSAGSGNTITVIITDATDTNCNVQVDVTDTGSCSTPACPPVKCLPITIIKN
jgi:hypothetical protein